MKIVALVLLSLLVVGVFGFVATSYDYGMFKFWAPKYENAKREVFENTQSYVQGKIQYLTTLQLAYATAEGSERAALRTTILREASTIPDEKLPVDLSNFIDRLKGER